MGYTTEFEGQFNIVSLKTGEPVALTTEQVAYLQQFNETRRMARNADLTAQRSDPIREAVGLPVGPQGAYFVGEEGSFGQNRSDDVINYSGEPEGQPGLWCQWTCDDKGEVIEWGGVEKFYYYEQWLAYIVEHFLVPWGYGLKGAVKWRGEEFDDIGVIVIQNRNEVWTGTPHTGDRRWSCKGEVESDTPLLDGLRKSLGFNEPSKLF